MSQDDALPERSRGSCDFAHDAAFVTFRDRRHAEFARGLRYSESRPDALTTRDRMAFGMS